MISHTMEMMWRDERDLGGRSTGTRDCASRPRIGRRLDRAVARLEDRKFDGPRLQRHAPKMRPERRLFSAMLDLVSKAGLRTASP